MNIEEVRDYCLAKKGVEETFPFGDEVLVFKVMGKAFLITGIDQRPFRFNVKCDPEKAIELRESYNCVKPGFHMNKKHWNTVYPDGEVPEKMIRSWIDHSYELVIEGLPKSIRAKLLKKAKK